MAFKMKSPFKSVNAPSWGNTPFGMPTGTPTGVPTGTPTPGITAAPGQATAQPGAAFDPTSVNTKGFNLGQMMQTLHMGHQPSNQLYAQATPTKPETPKRPKKRNVVSNTSDLAAEAAQAQSYRQTYTPASPHGSLMDFRGGGSALVKRRRRRNNRMRRQQRNYNGI